MVCSVQVYVHVCTKAKLNFHVLCDSFQEGVSENLVAVVVILVGNPCYGIT